VTYYLKNIEESVIKKDFEYACYDIKIKLDTRLGAHAQLLRSTSAYFCASDTVTREEWRNFYEREKISENLPGLNGVGYSVIIHKNQLNQHIQSIRKNGFPDYDVFPSGDRGLYTSVMYLEPFSGSNLRAFGYDMLSDSIRREAMELSRDSDYAMLTDKVILVHDANQDTHVGTLMFVPAYRKGMPINTLEERQSAIIGWVFSVYRMNDLLTGILGNVEVSNKNIIHLKIYDNDDISDKTLLYNSESNEKVINNVNPNIFINLPVDFNGKKWTLEFTGTNEDLIGFHGKVKFLFIAGIIISFLLSVLSLVINDRLLQSRQIQNLNKHLEKVNIDKDRFISILGHDLKGPFNNILGFSEILKEDVRKLKTNEIEEIAGNINKSAKITNKLLEDILIWARTQQGSIPFSPRNLSLSAMCRNVLEVHNPSANAKNITIYNSASDNLNVYADPDMLKTILLNLISNSIKFTNTGGKITINVEELSENITISVSDTGIGIPPENLAKLFDISEVMTTKGTAYETGTGLGLLLCKEFVEKHGGKIWVESEVGQGSEFKFTLPVFNP
jgi:signal transduction histidine kinase